MSAPVNTFQQAADRVLEEIWCGPRSAEEVALLKLAEVIGQQVATASPEQIRRIGVFAGAS